MRFKEFSNEADNIRFTKLIFDKALKALVVRYKKRIKTYKNKIRLAKINRKSKYLQSLKNTSTINVNTPDRPKR